MNLAITVPTTRTMIAFASSIALAECGGGSDDATDTSVAPTDSAPVETDLGVTEPPATEPPVTEPAPAQDIAVSADSVHGYWVSTAGASLLFVDFRSDGTFEVTDVRLKRIGPIDTSDHIDTDALGDAWRDLDGNLGELGRPGVR